MNQTIEEHNNEVYFNVTLKTFEKFERVVDELTPRNTVETVGMNFKNILHFMSMPFMSEDAFKSLYEETYDEFVEYYDVYIELIDFEIKDIIRGLESLEIVPNTVQL